jgi:Raf kinase inhibitor-like YbhB/YbcL family protein
VLTEIAMMLTLSSTAFGQDQRIPPRFARDGDNLSPPLEWHGAPQGTKSYALVVEDPDAPSGTFRHWAVYDIPGGTTALAEGSGSGKSAVARHVATNDFGDRHYDGPQPPSGSGVHHYHFRLFALDVPQLKLPGNASAHDVLDAARAHSLAQADLVGTYER